MPCLNMFFGGNWSQKMERKGDFLQPSYSGRYSLPFQYDVPIQTNSSGFRGDEFQFNKPDQEVRIVCLGDSFTGGFEVPLQNTWPKKLETRLNNESKTQTFQVINLGIPGLGTEDELNVLEQMGVQLNPDIVILGFFGHNDFRNNIHVNVEYRDNYLSSFFYGFKLKLGLLDVDDLNFPPFYNKGKSETKNLLSQLAQLSKEKGFKLMIVNLPGRIETHSHKKYRVEIEKPYQFLHSISEEFGVVFIPLLEDFLKYKKKQDLFYFFDGHYTEAGHALVANGLTDRTNFATGTLN